MQTPSSRSPYSTRDIVRLLLPHMHGEAVDLGAGTAKYKDMILTAATSYTAFDGRPGPHIDVVGDMLALPFPDASFDTAICTQVMEHVREPWTMVQEIARILRPGGTCVLTTPFLMPYHADPYDFFRYTIEGGCSLFERAGMRIIEKRKYGNIFQVFSELWKFTFCNPYVHTHPGFLRRNLFRLIQWTCSLPRSMDQRTHIYANIAIVAQKPS